MNFVAKPKPNRCEASVTFWNGYHYAQCQASAKYTIKRDDEQRRVCGTHKNSAVRNQWEVL